MYLRCNLYTLTTLKSTMILQYTHYKPSRWWPLVHSTKYLHYMKHKMMNPTWTMCQNYRRYRLRMMLRLNLETINLPGTLDRTM